MVCSSMKNTQRSYSCCWYIFKSCTRYQSNWETVAQIVFAQRVFNGFLLYCPVNWNDARMHIRVNTGEGCLNLKSIAVNRIYFFFWIKIFTQSSVQKCCKYTFSFRSVSEKWQKTDVHELLYEELHWAHNVFRIMVR